ncbi:hypothetical protein SEA_MOAB_3 [Streptomyces phage Moab]|nr:hypothetical protein SEA_MOAB_3 [Streptomyces phage Moab]WMI33640.1 hypothetical protein SEA_PATELGO_4 [Streptomyces phage Patelgo]
MATTKDVLEKLHSREEIDYWAAKGGFEVEDFPGGVYVGEYKINLEENRIVSVESRLDEPRTL